MAGPKRIVHTRPYDSVEELIEVEAWSVTREILVLVDHPEIAEGTALRVDLVLASGERLLRAEGRVLDQVAPEGDRPGGPRLALKRVTRESQKFLNRLVESEGNGAAPAPRARQFSLLDMDIELDPQQAQVAAIVQPGQPEPAPEPEPEPAREAPPALAADAGPPPPTVAAPPERDNLLERLRKRLRRGSD